ncbi:cation diffusion facilitator family transporter [Zhihengliuella flava]|uniref:Cobalt-zinc-cadmium efflux system protein n=1 Tax=Zhihengliuella flava TaxID=1285193 RepID=A0A931GF68_9MICC|nr:cation diffusion facilitator family transporter [Zhihengliuella flava]MBG6084890.1 cobalt-zinc-cadmium efflux system protein [Zhihengliuella flava]
MGHDHGHSHGLSGGTATGRHKRRLAAVVVITLLGVCGQLIGAALSGSLALLADAGHMLSDAAGVGIALFAAWAAARPATAKRTFGFQRAEVLAALANATILVVIAVVVTVEAIGRFGTAAEVATQPMLAAACIGLAANFISLAILHKGRTASVNLRGAYLEVLGDTLGSAAVIVAALIMMMADAPWADPVASLVIAAMILPRAWSLMREVVDVLLEATPRNIDLDEVREHLLSVEGVVDVHDLHAWTITSGVPVCSAHIVLDAEHFSASRADEVLDALSSCLGSHFDTEHCTFQLEPAEHTRHEHPTHD